MANLRQFSLRFQEFKTFRKISRLEFKETHAQRKNRRNRQNSVRPDLLEKFGKQKRKEVRNSASSLNPWGRKLNDRNVMEKRFFLSMGGKRLPIKRRISQEKIYFPIRKEAKTPISKPRSSRSDGILRLSF
ncbi:hypothetical protein DLM75_17930 [Leptospira stimsonii]|uniref:Uncharacterized protein n=1 Tax=Leptospira stimsonii TaxID=2202203 RepID=A0A396YVW3_9LEPT|nr:hypothetical protein DLM75_17930 [Leptospira stimsonii]